METYINYLTWFNLNGYLVVATYGDVLGIAE